MNDRVKSRPVEVATDAEELVTGLTNVMRVFRATSVRKHK
jgi:hypothetical protein